MTEIKHEIVQNVGILSESKSGWKREVNMVSWNDAELKLDIRDWSPDHSKMGKGISLNSAEVKALKQILRIEGNDTDQKTSVKEQPVEPEIVAEEPKIVEERKNPAKENSPSDSVQAKQSRPSGQKHGTIPDAKLQKRLEQISSGFQYLSDIYTWDAFRLPPEVDKFFEDDQLYLSYCSDAAKTVTKIKYDLSYIEIREMAERLFRDLLRKYHFPKEKMNSAVHEMLVRFFLGRSQVFRAIEEEENYQGEIPELADDDMDTIDMAYIFAILPEQPEIEAYLKDIDVTYNYDQLHMVTWFSCQVTLGSGHYSRSVPNHSAKTTYNRLLNPYSLLWIAAALGVEKELVIATAKEAEEKKTFAAKCGVVRKAIPFSRIKELADQRFAEYIKEHPEAMEEDDEEPEE